MRIWLWEYAFWVMGICILVMLGYGHDESAPTPCGVFAAIHFAHDKWFVRCMLDILLYVKTTFLHYKKVVFKKQQYCCVCCQCGYSSGIYIISPFSSW